MQDRTLVIVLDEGNGFHLEQLKKEEAKVRQAIRDTVNSDPMLKFTLGKVPANAKAANGVAPTKESVMEQARKANPSIDEFIKRIDGQAT